ncbi:MAG: hypothetical protein E6Q50_03060 [Lysobacter sp.]|nr:MAG: hypothetical protein E6Q50_03060 [Lysobacter sp.]
MSFTRFASRSVLALIAGGVLLTDGCVLFSRITFTPSEPLGSVSPRLYCPGDGVTASFDLLRDTPCVSRPGLDCAALAPTIDIASSPTEFAPQRIVDFRGRVDFTPASGSVNVTFTPALRSYVEYPSGPASGTDFTRRRFTANTIAASRVDGDVMRQVEHGGMCAGSAPTHADGVVPGPPELSASLRLRRICNSSATQIILSVPGLPGEMIERSLAPGQCFLASEPGVPPDVAALRTYSVRAAVLDPNARCSAIEDRTPPTPLRTTVWMGCGM